MTRKWSLPFGPLVIFPKTTETLNCHVGTLYEGHDLVNQGDEDDLFIVDILTDGKTQMPSDAPSGGFPAGVFQEPVLSGNNLFDRCRTFTLKVCNTGSRPRTFQAYVAGRVGFDG